MMKQNMVLDLPLKKEWYEMIESGIKTEEYREIKPYWMKRLLEGVLPYFLRKIDNSCASFYCEKVDLLKDNYNYGSFLAKPYTHVRFRYGYTKRTMLFELDKITIGKGKTEWGAPDDKEVFILKLGKRL